MRLISSTAKRGKFYRVVPLSLLVLLSLSFGLSESAYSKNVRSDSKVKRDPKQKTVFISDVDGTGLLNLGNIILYRVNDPSRHLLGQNVSNLPPSVKVPVNDWEGNTGPKIRFLIGSRDERGGFIPSASQERVSLSNGTDIVPGYYYLDPERSFDEFRTFDGPIKNTPVASEIRSKIKARIPFLLEGSLFWEIGSNPEFTDQVDMFWLSKRGHAPEEASYAFQKELPKQLGWGGRTHPESHMLMLSHPSAGIFRESKANAIRKIADVLTTRHMATFDVPHYIVVAENDYESVIEFQKLFRGLASRGIGRNPVHFVLVNLLEDEVLRNPDGVNWKRSPLDVANRMSRVTIYRPEAKIERYDDLKSVLTETLQMTEKQAADYIKQFSQKKCKKLLVPRGILPSSKGRAM